MPINTNGQGSFRTKGSVLARLAAFADIPVTQALTDLYKVKLNGQNSLPLGS